MSSTQISIVKRDGKRVPFSMNKIKNAIRKAFLSVGSFASDDDLTNILHRVNIQEDMNVEEVQNQVERSLMAENYFAVAKSYMLYRQKHSEDRETRDRIKFLIEYCAAGMLPVEVNLMPMPMSIKKTLPHLLASFRKEILSA
ncbi:ATP cone domain-containing protein [uncultured Draconibacterium sp.]|uniref:ATP cone domain-containing protein n=1 Tax=uncultured Draconibacterium sp. TaxID=1573823 RepID=UPI0029C6E7B7|nr:ATP cone domain-containing protein [uncultured Draconibacterium sp.]